MTKPKAEFTPEYLADAEHWCYLALKEYQKAKDDLDILHDAQKDLLASLMTEQDKPEEKTSEVKLERLARTSEEWKKFKLGYQAAVREAGERKVKYDSAVRMWDTVVSGMAFRREELKKLQG